MVILVSLVVVALVVVGMTKPEVLNSWLVRTGAAALFLTSALLFVFPAMITGLLFFFSAPIALLLILVGTIVSVVKSDKRMNADVAALADAAKRTGRLWPDDSPLRQLDAVVKHGPHAGRALVSLLRFESEEQFSDPTWNPSVEQHAELALCRIYGEVARGARSVYDVRATAIENSSVKRFWELRVRESK